MSAGAARGEALRLEPDPSGWGGLLAARWRAVRDDAERMCFRESLGLPTDRPVVMTGHQPIFFHPGVLAKYLAAAALGRNADATVAWLVVDEDETDPGVLAVPQRDRGGRLSKGEVRLLDAPPPGTPAGAVDPSAVRDEGSESHWPFVREGLASVRSALRAHTGARSLADQSALASFDLMKPLDAIGAPVMATALVRTELFARVLGRMADDPLGFVERYNAAAAAYPGAGVAPLMMSLAADRYELPLWTIEPGKPRRRVYAEDLDTLPHAVLAPRALLMTLLVRMAGCDLFIHGTGGWVYDRITERLAQDWLGETLAPMTLATATLTLPLLERDPPAAQEVAGAQALAHRAAHDPGLLEDNGAAASKRRLVKRIERSPRHSTERAAAFREMHDLLDATRRTHTGTLDALRARAASMRREHEAAGIALERTWAFPLYPIDALRGLRDGIDASFRG